MSDDLKGRVAFVTGAAHGQGRATALALAAEGMDIVAFDVAKPLPYPGYALGSADDLATLAAACSERGVRCLTRAGEWTRLHTPAPGRYRLSARYRLPRGTPC